MSCFSLELFYFFDDGVGGNWGWRAEGPGWWFGLSVAQDVVSGSRQVLSSFLALVLYAEEEERAAG